MNWTLTRSSDPRTSLIVEWSVGNMTDLSSHIVYILSLTVSRAGQTTSRCQVSDGSCLPSLFVNTRMCS